MIELKQIELAYGARKLFDNLDCLINRGDRIGLVGSNGAGKTTLLKVIIGQEAIDKGTLIKPNYVSIGYLAQENLVLGERKLFDEVELAFENVIELRKQEQILDEVIKTQDVNSSAYLEAIQSLGDIAHRLEDAMADKVKFKVEAVLLGLGFSLKDMDRKCSEFSGAWQMRIALAKLLLKNPSILMLDEPTNHLDIESLAWLEDYLKNYKGAVLVVSHDMAFLDLLSTKTFHINKGKVDVYAGNYSFFLKESKERKLQLQKAAQNQQKMLDKTQEFIDRFRSKNTKAAQVQSRIKALSKIEKIQVDSDEDKISFRFPPAKRSAQVVLDVNNLSKSFKDLNVLKNVSLQIQRGQKVAIVGVNGAGKTTLVKIIAGEEKADFGEVKFGTNVEYSYFAQHQTQMLNKDNDVLTEASAEVDFDKKTQARSLLGSLLFKADDVFKLVKVLSGGEKNRLALAKILLKDFNFLILDEPTNHLDINSKKILQQALQNYDGTLLMVSHDRAFIDPIADRIIEVRPNSVREFFGKFSDYLEKIKLEKTANSSKPKDQKVSSFKEKKKEQIRKREESSKLKKALKLLEEKISEIEVNIAEIESEMANPDFFKNGSKSNTITQSYNNFKTELEELYADWEKTQEQLLEISQE